VVFPVAYDGTSTWCKGSDKGPDAIIEASANMELYDIETGSEVYRKGIFTEEILEGMVYPEDVVESVYSEVDYHIKEGRFVVVIGGEHSVSIGGMRSHAEVYEGMGILQMDAHADLRPKYEGSKFNHACVMARAREHSDRIVQVGIRSMDESEVGLIKKEDVFFASEIHNRDDWYNKAIKRLPEKVYITIDMDVFDPSIMPSVGTPEPGGLGWYGSLAFLKKVISERQVVGFDVVELCPNSRNKGPDFLAAKLIYKLLSYRFGA
jgi:agmatinase